MRNALSLLKNKNIQQFFYGLLPIFIAFIALSRYFQLQEKSVENTVLLPDACGNFTLVAGSLQNATIILLGENHAYVNQVVACMFSLIQVKKFSSFDFYHEGKSIPAGENPRLASDIAEIREKAVGFFSWDNAAASDEAMTYYHQIFEIDVTRKFEFMYRRFNSDKKMYLYLKELKKGTSAFNALLERGLIKAFLPIYASILMEAKNSLVSLYEQHNFHLLPSSKNTFFSSVFDAAFRDVRKRLPASCATYGDDELTLCYQEAPELLPSIHHKRDVSLLRNIENAVQQGRPAFFRAGRKHADAIVGNLSEGAKDKVAVLRMFINFY